jgi:hypothetical protein
MRKIKYLKMSLKTYPEYKIMRDNLGFSQDVDCINFLISEFKRLKKIEKRYRVLKIQNELLK